MFKMHKLTVRRPKDCSDLEPNRDTSGVYTIYPTRGRGVKVYCDMKTDGGRWTVSLGFYLIGTYCANVVMMFLILSKERYWKKLLL